jgi:hypothetical protein
MKIRELRIERLQLTLPRGQGSPRPHDAGVLAKSVADNLAESLRLGSLSTSTNSLANLQITVPRDRANGPGISRAIQASLRHPSSSGKKER